MRRIKVFKVRGKNSLRYWHKVRNPIRVIINFLIIYACRFIPSLMLKNLLYKLVGIRIGKNVSIGFGALFDFFFPELIEIGENSIIGYNTTVLAHEFLVNEWRRGRVRIGKNVLIGANCLILPGVVVGDNATISSMSLVNKDVKPKKFVGGVPIKTIKRFKS